VKVEVSTLPFLVGPALLSVLLIVGCREPEPAAPKTVAAVIVVDVDTLRADGLSVYGNARPTTPHFDALAAEGCRFEWAFAQAPYTLPSQVTLFTSLYPHSHGVVHERDRLGEEAVTLAEAFRAASWRTAAFVDGGYVSEPFGLAQGFETFVDSDRAGLRRSESAIRDWIKANRDRPFLLVVHTYDTHSPYDPPEPWRSRFLAAVEPPSPGFEPTSEVLEEVRASQWSGEPRRLPERDLAYARALYNGEVAFVDSWFGRLVSDLRDLDLFDRSVIAVVSDHGEEFGEHGSVLHEKLYSTVTRVPMIIRAPGGTPAVIRRAVETVDLMPTLLDLAGIPLPAGLQGRSLAASVRSGAEPAPKLGLGHSPFYGEQRAAVSDEYHAIVTLESSKIELFRYRTDPLEARDLAAEAADDGSSLARRMSSAISRLPGPDGSRPQAELSAEAEASLRALGYLR
jgi:arylsulfatase A-like enzyme